MSKFHPAPSMPTWRRIALSAWSSPRDPTAYGTLELDCENALAYIAKLRQKTGEKITLTHLVGKIVAMTIAASPEVNGFVSGGWLQLRDTVDIFFQVAFFDDDGRSATQPGQHLGDAVLAKSTKKKDANLAGAKITSADKKSIPAIAKELRERAEAIRSRGDAETAESARLMAKIPRRLVGLVTRASAFLSYDMGLDLRRFGIPRDAFGSCMVTNIGVFGLSVGHAPLVPFARVPVILTLGAVRDVAAVVGEKIVARKSVAIGVAFDHRVMDGYHAGMMAKRFRDIFADPERALGDAELRAEPAHEVSALRP